MPEQGFVWCGVGPGGVGRGLGYLGGSKNGTCSEPSPSVLGPSTATTALQTMAHCPFPAASVQAKTYSPQGPQYENSLIPEILATRNVARST